MVTYFLQLCISSAFSIIAKSLLDEGVKAILICGYKHKLLENLLTLRHISTHLYTLPKDICTSMHKRGEILTTVKNWNQIHIHMTASAQLQWLQVWHHYAGLKQC